MKVYEGLESLENDLKNKLTFYEHDNNLKVVSFKKVSSNDDAATYARTTSDGQITLIYAFKLNQNSNYWRWFTPRTNHIDELYNFLKHFTKIEKNNVQVHERANNAR